MSGIDHEFYRERAAFLAEQDGTPLVFKDGQSFNGFIDLDDGSIKSYQPVEGANPEDVTSTIFVLPGAAYSYFRAGNRTTTGQTFVHENKDYKIREVQPISFGSVVIQTRLVVDTLD